ncbi:MAG: hypothetical protein KAV43_03575 [Hadesarchaea archaeon]|nr:hypothetical protein [Hadesarchaea archaeon]
MSVVTTINAKSSSDTMLLSSPNRSQPFNKVVRGASEYHEAYHDHEQIEPHLNLS